MSGHVLSALVSSLLSLSLISPGSSSRSGWAVGDQGWTIAQLQGDLAGLGYDAGPESGVMTTKTLTAAADFVTQFGSRPQKNLIDEVNAQLRQLPSWPTGGHGAAVLAVQNWLGAWHLYRGRIDGTWSPSLDHAVKKFQTAVGLNASGRLTGQTLALMAHLFAVRVAYQKRWPYQAQSGDTLTDLAFATGLPLSTLKRANTAHGSMLWRGQTLYWSAPVASSLPSRVVTPSPAPGGLTSSSPQSLYPVAAMVWVSPDTQTVKALLTAEKLKSHPLLPDVSVSGQWALEHPRLVRALSRAGNEIDICGYSQSVLNRLPLWGVRQELQWSERVLASELGVAPTFLVTSEPSNAVVQHAASDMGLLELPATQYMHVASGDQQALVQFLVTRQNGLLVVNGSMTEKQWQALFGALKDRHFSFLTLGQLWAGG